MQSTICSQCLDDLKSLKSEADQVESSPCLCYCRDPSIVYCSSECRSLHWFLHKHDCSHAVHSLHEVAEKITSVEAADLLAVPSTVDAGLAAPLLMAQNGAKPPKQLPTTPPPARHLAAVPRRGKAPGPPPHYMTVAKDLIDELKSNPREGTNIYAGLPSFVVRDGTDSCARTQCATFISRLWKISYGLSDRELKAWLQSDLVWGEDYYHHIQDENGFLKVHHIEDVSAGDMIAMKYERTAFNTGHVMLVESIEPGQDDAPPIIPDTVQWNVTILDSTRTHHMSGDSRYKPQHPGGIGRGPCRLYSSKATGQIVGYTWSNWPKTAYYGIGGARLFAVGRPVHFLDHVSKKTSKEEEEKKAKKENPQQRSGAGLDNFNFNSGSDEAGSSSSFGETSDNGETHQMMSVKCGEATEGVGKELLQCRDFKEAGIVWYSLGRSKRGGAELAHAMVVSAGCYNITHKYDAALRAAEKVILEYDITVLNCMMVGHGGNPGRDPSLPLGKLQGNDPVVMIVLAYSQSAKANTGLGFHDSALQHYRTVSFHVSRWLGELRVGRESTVAVSKYPLAQWLELQLAHFQDEVACLLRLLYPSVVLAKDEGDGSKKRAAGLGLKSAHSVLEGQLVLTEEPILVWTDNDHATATSPFNMGLFKAYLTAPLSVQRQILSMHSAELSVTDSAMMRAMLKDFLAQHSEELHQVVQHLVTLASSAASVQQQFLMGAGLVAAVQHASSAVAGARPASPSTKIPAPISPDPLTIETLLPLELAMALVVIARCNSHAVEVVGDEEGVPAVAAVGKSNVSASGAEVTYSGIYSMMSKVQHSCSPNLSYDGKRRAYYALRPIKEGELLTFSYAGRDCLGLSTPMRRQHLHQGFLFHCQCRRCAGIDYSRGFRCGMKGCRGTCRHQGDAASSANLGSAWKCDSCAEYWGDDEMRQLGHLRREKELQSRLEELGPAIQKGELVKNQFDKVKQLVIDTQHHYGAMHWLSTESIKLMIRFYLNLGTQGATGRSVLTRNASAKLAAKWTEFFLRCVSSQHLLDLAPVTVAEEILSFAKIWGKESCLHSAKLKVYRLVYPFFVASTYDGSITTELREALMASKDGLPPSVHTSTVAAKQKEVAEKAKSAVVRGRKRKMGTVGSKKNTSSYSVVEPKTVWSIASELGAGADGMTITDLFEEWENYLGQRVGTSLNSNRDPKDLPPGLVEAMRRGGGVVENMQ